MSSPDPHFPAIHLRPPRHWVNDPNGLTHHDGHFHVFFQFNPDSARHENMHWGHWRSRDLRAWELLPVALSPEPGGDDADGVWSGNAVSVDGRLVAFYSARRDDRWWQPVTSASSNDGVHFEKSPRLLVSEPPPGTVMFRDPYVWRDAHGWRMLVGAALDDGRAAALQYTSPDLVSWDYVGPFLARHPEPLTTGDDTAQGWECVQYAQLTPGRGVLVVSGWNPATGAARAAAYVGQDRGAEFLPTQLLAFDHGPDAYAPALLHAPDGRWLAWAWVWEARDEARVGAPGTWIDEVGWAGMLSIPRELSLTDHGLHQAPAREVDELRGRLLVRATTLASSDEPSDLGTVGTVFDAVAVLSRSVDGKAASGMRLVTSNDGRECLDIGLDPTTGDVVVDRSRASLDPRAKRGSWRLPTAVAPGGSVEVRAVVDGSVVEVFTETGMALTARFYPCGRDGWRLRTNTAGEGAARLVLDAWELAPLDLDTGADRS
ncbi:glycoside hydrolase family 32 protein [Nocardioides sp. LS1]|uniref:glycoside hydrolase family 32 protein n=1 Tax=Nocardioides sp. LS1 TaxID=1027620 RepID=UPI000F623BD1|nr:glycoside hydrolase family 32 protein [Nocardioides sp. LS1]GCD88566.1 glycosyl hydrolase family 32 [Nocardioides sp. LS1]